MAQWLRALAAFEDDLLLFLFFFKIFKQRSVSSTHIAALNCLVSAILGDVRLFSDLCRYHVCMW